MAATGRLNTSLGVRKSLRSTWGPFGSRLAAGISRLDRVNGLWDLSAAAGWAYLIIFVMALLDGLFPVLPAETTIIAGGALAASGHLEAAGVLGATFAGVVVGDLLTHELTRRGRARQFERWSKRPRTRQAIDWATKLLGRHGAKMVFGGRFIPLGRTSVSLVSGVSAMPRRKYLPPLLAGAALWSVYVGSLGYFGGSLFGNPLISVGIGVGLSLTLTATAGLVGKIKQQVHRRRDADRAYHDAQPVGRDQVRQPSADRAAQGAGSRQYEGSQPMHGRYEREQYARHPVGDQREQLLVGVQAARRVVDEEPEHRKEQQADAGAEVAAVQRHRADRAIEGQTAALAPLQTTQQPRLQRRQDARGQQQKRHDHLEAAGRGDQQQRPAGDRRHRGQWQQHPKQWSLAT